MVVEWNKHMSKDEGSIVGKLPKHFKWHSDNLISQLSENMTQHLISRLDVPLSAPCASARSDETQPHEVRQQLRLQHAPHAGCSQVMALKWSGHCRS
eukprot:363596-Chlamydomonas_euryale.AAC.1